jgi:hypothetical protein
MARGQPVPSPIWNPLRRWPAAIVLLCALTGGSGAGFAFEASAEIPALRAALERGQLAQLEDKFAAYQRAFEQGHGSEWVVDDNFETFKTSDPDFAAPLDRWVEQYPKSFAAPMARAVYLSYRASLAGGFLQANDIPDKRLREIESWATAAARDYATALARHPKLSVAYAGLIDLAKRAHDGAAIEELFEKGLGAVPDSAVIYAAYIDSLYPGWGLQSGTSQQVQRRQVAYLGKIRKMYAGNPDFAWLGGYEHYLSAVSYYNADCQLDAVVELADAIKAHENWYYYFERGKAYECQADGSPAAAGAARKALIDYERALELNPHDVDVLLRLGGLETRLCKGGKPVTDPAQDLCAAALKHYKRAVERDPLNAEAALALADALSHQQDQTDEVKRLLADALVYGGDDFEMLRGHALVLSRFDARAAAEEYSAAIRRSPNEQDAIKGFRAFVALLEGGRCQALPLLAELEQMCRKSDKCRTEIGVHLDSFQMQSGHACGAEMGPAAVKPLPMPNDMIPQ